MKWEELSLKDRAELMRIYLDNGISSIASIKKHYNSFADGGPLKDEYDNPDQYYDYITAEEAGDMYDPKTKHWSSRDPRSGMILKNPKHHTFGMALREDQSSGYTPFIDMSTDRYYTFTPEEYAIAPNKTTLRKLKEKEVEDLYKEGNLDSWNKRKDFEKIIPGHTREELTMKKLPYRDTLWEAAKDNNINPEILDALATTESRYSNEATSSAGAKGMMQLMPVNTKDINPRDGHQNIKRGAEVLSYFLKRNKGDMKKAIAAYNGYGKDPETKVRKEETEGYSDNYYKVLFPLIDSLEKNSTTGYPFENGGKLGGAHGEIPFTTDYSTIPEKHKKTITLDNLHELAKDNPSAYKKYMQKLPKEYQAKVIENAARNRYGYEGLNEAMYIPALQAIGSLGVISNGASRSARTLKSVSGNLNEFKPIRRITSILNGAEDYRVLTDKNISKEDAIKDIMFRRISTGILPKSSMKTLLNKPSIKNISRILGYNLLGVGAGNSGGVSDKVEK